MTTERIEIALALALIKFNKNRSNNQNDCYQIPTTNQLTSHKSLMQINTYLEIEQTQLRINKIEFITTIRKLVESILRIDNDEQYQQYQHYYSIIIHMCEVNDYCSLGLEIILTEYISPVLMNCFSKRSNEHYHDEEEILTREIENVYYLMTIAEELSTKTKSNNQGLIECIQTIENRIKSVNCYFKPSIIMLTQIRSNLVN
jgi:hypothetical protein